MRRRPLTPRVSLVTGGAAGIGLALARRLAGCGSRVVVADVDEAGAEQACADLRRGGHAAEAVAVDVRDTEAIRGLVDDVVARHGSLDVMCNNAGVLLTGPFDEVTDEHWAAAWEINTRSVLVGTQAAYEHMRRQGSGHILNTGSLAGLMPAPLSTPYTMSKWAVVGFSQALRSEAAPHGVNVSVLCPGYVDTRLLDESFAPTASHVDGSFRDHAGRLQGRLTTPDQVAEHAIDGLRRRRAVITVGAFARTMSRLHAHAPRVVELGTRIDTAREVRRLARARGARS